MEVLVTGGAGYIGSTICSALNDRGDTPIVLDNLLSGAREFAERFPFYEGDIADRDVLLLIRKHFPKCSTIIHCAARTIVSESTINPFEYYFDNVNKSVIFFNNAKDYGFKNIIFSSSASVYGDVTGPAVDERCHCFPASPYAKSKFMIENVLSDFCAAYGIRGTSLRYFNPIGADPELRTGQLVKNPTHLLGRLLALKVSDSFEIFGKEWDTRDGTPIRDFIHVWDLARAHLASLDHLIGASSNDGKHEVINLGTGLGTTVKEFVDAFKRVTSRQFPVSYASPRDGDILGAFADVSKAKVYLNWSALKTVDESISDSIKWLEKRTNSV